MQFQFIKKFNCGKTSVHEIEFPHQVHFNLFSRIINNANTNGRCEYRIAPFQKESKAA